MYVGKIQDCSSQDSRTIKLQKEVASYYETQPFER